MRHFFCWTFLHQKRRKGRKGRKEKNQEREHTAKGATATTTTAQRQQTAASDEERDGRCTSSKEAENAKLKKKKCHQQSNGWVRPPFARIQRKNKDTRSVYARVLT